MERRPVEGRGCLKHAGRGSNGGESRRLLRKTPSWLPFLAARLSWKTLGRFPGLKRFNWGPKRIGMLVVQCKVIEELEEGRERERERERERVGKCKRYREVVHV